MAEATMTMSGGVAEGELSVLPIAAQKLSVKRGGRNLLDIPDFAICDHRLTTIIGPNGAGKSLLVKILAGVAKPDRGSVLWAGEKPMRAGYQKLSLVLQSPVLLRRTAFANVVYALKAAGETDAQANRLAHRALDRAGLTDVSATSARLLSGGEKQRLALARALAIGPDVLLLDEPVANLDPASTLAIEDMISQARDAGVSVVLVTHDLAQARRLADEIVFMHRGKIVERGSASTFFKSPRTELAAAFVRGEILA